MQLVLATNNPHKIEEIRALLAALPITVLTRDDFLEFPDPEETGITLEANAEIKARAILEATGWPALADDTGLEVDALDGAPGVYSARYAGPTASYADNCTKLLEVMRDVPGERRTARFRTAIAIAWSVDEVEWVDGEALGAITTEPRGASGFGYDPVFFYPPLQKTFAEMSADEKNVVSHRGRALAAAVERIERRLTLSS